MRTPTHLPIRLATLVCIGSVDLYLWRLRNVSYSLTVTCNKQSFIFVRTHWQPPLQIIYCKCDVRYRQKWSGALMRLFINKKDREFMIINRTNFITALISTLWNVHKLWSNITVATCDRWHVNENMWHENACTVDGIYQFTNGTNQSEFIIWWHHCIFALLSNSNSN